MTSQCNDIKSHEHPIIIPPLPTAERLARVLAVLVPLAYVWLYTPYGMDTTDFGFFYGYPWRILQGEIPYRDFYYINPSFPLFWHAFWLKITPTTWGILGGKLGYVAGMLGTAWMTTLFLNRVFDLRRMGLSLPLLATGGFVWGVHTFAHVPWHTLDGVLFASGALFAGAAGWPLLAGALAGCSFLSKQSFLLFPLALLLMIWTVRPRKRETLWALLGFAAVWTAFWFFLQHVGAWDAFRLLTSKPLDMQEALEAGIYIYLRQEWWLPAVAIIPWLLWNVWQRCTKDSRPVPEALQPALLYLTIIAARYMHEVGVTRGWIGFGESWPTLWVVLGGLCVLLPAVFLRPYVRAQESSLACVDAGQPGQEAQGHEEQAHEEQAQALSASFWRSLLCPGPLLRGSVALGAALLVAWSAGVSGGYKTPAFYAVPLLFALVVVHARLGGKPATAAWAALLLGLVMFRVGYEYPYTFPDRPMPRASLIYDAGDIFPKASGVMVDKEIYETLAELKQLRAKYGANYRVLPGFPHAYFLTNDKPAFSSEWLLDWQIAHQFDKVYQELLDRDVTVFMLRDQMFTEQADGYKRAGYTVPQMVRKRWRVVEETPHYVVMRPPQ